MLFLHFPLASSNAPKIEEVHSIPKVPEPKYKIIKEPPEGIPEFLLIEIALPGIVSAMKFLFLTQTCIAVLNHYFSMIIITVIMLHC